MEQTKSTNKKESGLQSQTDKQLTRVHLARPWLAIATTLGLVFAGVGGFAVLLWASSAFDDIATAVTFITGNTLNLFVFLAIVAQACIYWAQRGLMQRQWEAMAEELIETRSLVTHNETMAKIMQDQFELTALSIKRQVEAHNLEMANMRFQAETVAGQLDAMLDQKRMTTIGERAYLGIEDVKLVTPITNNTLTVNALFINGGRTPAIGIDRKFQIGVVRETGPCDWKSVTGLQEPNLSILPAGGKKWVTFPLVPITSEEFAEFDAGDRIIDVSGQLRFKDYAGNKQIFEFRMTCEAENNGSFKEEYQRQYDDPD